MLEGIKKRLLHFDTDGVSVISDFVCARQRRAGVLRRVVHACFYIQCAAALVCVVIGFAAGGAFPGVLLTIGALASAAAALAAVPGDQAIATVSYFLDLVYAVICFVAGGIFTPCGAIMLLSSLAALCGFFTGHLRGFLLSYPASGITPGDYTLTGTPPVPPPESQPLPQEPQKPRSSELMMIAEQVAQILNPPHDNNGKEHVQ